LGPSGHGTPMSVGRLLEARVYRSLRLRGQLLVLGAALLGAVMGWRSA
jgi:hypothetical protein